VPKGRLQGLPCSQASIKQEILGILNHGQGQYHDTETNKTLGQVVRYQGREDHENLQGKQAAATVLHLPLV
jgi:CobQ-like glutamine amidotransferase family enzyme